MRCALADLGIESWHAVSPVDRRSGIICGGGRSRRAANSFRGHSDPPQDAEHPARMQVVAILSHGSTMNGVLYRAAGAGPNPTLLLMHGFPGNEQNLDVAQAVRRAGWNVLTFHYRGAWGSEGAFSFSHAIEDADAAIAFLRDPANATKYGIDITRIAVAGHSMGGFMAAHAGANDKTLIGVAMISAWNIGAKAALAKSDSDRAKLAASMAGDLDGLAGCTAASLTADALSHQAEWNFIDYAGALATHPLLLISSNDGNGRIHPPWPPPSLKREARQSQICRFRPITRIPTTVSRCRPLSSVGLRL